MMHGHNTANDDHRDYEKRQEPLLRQAQYDTIVIVALNVTVTLSLSKGGLWESAYC